MIAPLPLFATREWAIRAQEGYWCPSCHQERLRTAPICPGCYGTHATLIGSSPTPDGRVARHYRCDACGTEHRQEGRVRLECDACHASFDDGWHRHHYAETRPSFIRGSVPVHGELFATVQHYLGRPDPEEDAYHLADFVIDIDRDGDLDAAGEAALAYARFLDEHGAFYRLFFSGGKGYHLQVPFQALGALPHAQLNSWHYKKLAQELQERVGHELDLAIYTRRRMLRVEHSLHLKSGLYKVRIARNDLEARRAGVLDLAKTPNPAPTIFGSGIVQDVKEAPPLREVYQRALERSDMPEVSSTKAVAAGIGAFQDGRHLACVQKALEDGPPGPGTRHKLNLNMAAYWVANGLDPDEFIAWARDVPGGSDTPESERVHEAAGALRWAQRNRPPFRCKTMQDLGLCDPKCPFFTGRSGSI